MIGNIIKKARKNQKLELGGCDPSAKTMIKLTEILGLKDELFPPEARLESRLKEDIT